MFKKMFVCMFLMIYSFAFGEGYQVIVSQFNVGLKDSRDNKLPEDDKRNYKYSLTEGIKNGDIKSINSTSLDNTINHIRTMGNTFTGSEGDLQYDFNTAEKSIIIPVSSSSPTSGAFELSEVVGNVKNYYIQEKYVFPEKLGELSKVSSDTGVKFTYTEKPNNYTKYKRQEYMIRIAKGSNTVDYTIESDSNGKKLANAGTNAADFLGGVNGSYVDFWVTGDQYDKEQTITTDKGLSLKFFPGKIEVFGLPEGSYVIEMYSFRYSKEVTSSGSVVITKEDNDSFDIGATSGIDIINFSSEKFPQIKATILTVSTSSTINAEDITVTEDTVNVNETVVATSGAIYITSSAFSITTSGAIDDAGKHYQLWEVTYNSPDTSVDTDSRKVVYKNNRNNLEATTTYKVRGAIGTDFSDRVKYPLYQTVFVGFTESGTYTNGKFEIEDRYMNKYSDGYESLRTANVPLTSGAIDIERIYKGNGVVSSPMNFDNNSYNWDGSTTTGNAIIITKPKSDSKGTYRKIGDTGKTFTFYTTTWEPKFKYEESGAVLNPTGTQTQATDTMNFSWEAPTKTSYDTTISEEKIIFRIIKSSSDSETYRYKPEEGGTHPIIVGETDEEKETRLTNFLAGDSGYEYFDIIFKSGEDSEQIIGDTVFTFSKENKLKIVGLQATQSFKLQIYSLQNEDTVAQTYNNYDYRVLTYGGTLKKENGEGEEEDVVTVGWPLLITGDFKYLNNFYIIESIKVNSKLENNQPVKEIDVGVILKTSKQIPSTGALGVTNLKAKKDERASQSLYYENLNFRMAESLNPDYTKSGVYYDDVKPVEAVTVTSTGITVAKSTKQDFHYPLDIIICADASGSMSSKLNSVRLGMTAAVAKLEAMGYDVKFNVISLEAPQDAWLLNGKDTDGSRIKFVPETNDGKDAFDVEQSTGYGQGVVDGAIRYDKFDYNDTSWSTYKSSHIIDGASPSKKMNYQESSFDQFDENAVKLTVNGNNNSNPKIPNPDPLAKTVREKTADTNIYNILQNKDFQTSGGRLVRNGEYYLTVYKGNDSGTGNGWFSDTATAMKAIEQVGANGARGSSIYWDGVSGSQGNGAWALHYAIKRLTDYGREINTLGEIVTDPALKNPNNIKSEKWIIIAADEHIDAGPRVEKIGYTQKTSTDKGNVIESIANQAIAQNIKLTIMHNGLSVGNNTKTRAYNEFDTYKATTSGSALELSSWIFDGNNIKKSGGSNVTIENGVISDAEDMGWIQRWNIKYKSPFPKSDGKTRETIFSINGLTDYTNNQTLYSEIILGTRLYKVPRQNIEAYFLNPSDTEGDENYHKLEKKANGILLKAKAQSQYIENDAWVNKPITKATFIISGTSELGKTESITLSSDTNYGYGKVTIDGTTPKGVTDTSKWYYPEVTIDTKKFNEKFGKNHGLLRVSFIAETAEESTMINISGVTVADKTAPTITDFKMTNVTLKDFMEELKDSSSKKIFDMTDSQVINKFNSELSPNANGAITADSFTDDKKLNVKDKDRVLIEFIIDDESITKDSLGVGINYKQTPYRATGENISDSSNPYRTKWTVEIPVSLHAEGADVNLVTNIELNITDDNNNKLYRADDGTKTPYYVNVFNSPDLLPNTTLVEPNNPNRYKGDTNTDYYSTKTISSNKITGALAYLMAFEYDSNFVDEGAVINPSTNGYGLSSGTKKWVSSLNGDFSFYEGKHIYDGKVYVINASGAITELTHYGIAGYPSEERRLIDGVNFANVLDNINIPTTNPNIFYVDTIAPVVTSLKLEKSADANSELNSGIADEIINGLIGETVTVAGGTDYKRPYKDGDSLTLSGAISEKNIGKTTIGGENIFTDEGLGTTTGTSFNKTGTAKSLGTNIKIDEERDVIVYDKAGNRAEYVTDKTGVLTADKVQLNIVFDNRDPNALETNAYTYNGSKIQGIISGNTTETKYTRDNKLPLTSSTNGIPLSVVKVKTSSTALDTTAKYGDVRKGTGDLYSIGYSVSGDGGYTPNIVTYSYSGVKSTEVNDKIILDTEVGTLSSIVALKNTKAEILADRLNVIFENTYERVGLGTYSIRPLTAGVNSMALDGSNYVVGTKMPLSGALYTEASSISSNIAGERKFTFEHASGGTYKFAITLFDRLGNSKDVEYIVEIPNNVKIIGKTSGSTKQIETKINNASNKVKVESRKE